VRAGAGWRAGLVCLAAPVLAAGEEDLRIFALRLEGRTVVDSLPGFPDGEGGFRFPLGELCQALGLGIQVDARAGTATGFILQPGRAFHLDLAQGRAQLAGRVLALDRDRVGIGEGDLQVPVTLLEQWLPVRLRPDLAAAVLQVEPLEELPIQAGWAREARHGGLGPRAVVDRSAWPRADAPYSLWDAPFVDQSLDLALRSPTGPALRGHTLLTGDLLWCSSAIAFTSAPGAPFGQFRAQLARQDPEGGLLGPLAARCVELGDVTIPALPLLGGSPAGLGLHISGYPSTWAGSGDHHELTGPLAPGWAVELYQNDGLVAYQKAGVDGRYHFPDLPLRRGLNDFRLAFHGPAGQYRETRSRLDLNAAQMPAGQFGYRIAGTQPGHFQLEAAFGLTSRLDLQAGLAQLPARQGAPPQPIATVAAQGCLPGLSSRLALARDPGGGSAASIRLGTGWGRQSCTLEHTVLHAFQGPGFAGADALRRRTRAYLHTAWPAPPWQMNLEVQRDQAGEGGSSTRTALGLATRAGRWHVSNQMAWGPADAAGTLLTSRHWGPTALRGFAGYGLPAPRLRSLAVEGDTFRWAPWGLQARLERDLAGADTRASLALERAGGTAALTLRLAHSGRAGFELNLGLRCSLGREPRSGRWLASAQPLAAQGAVSVRAWPADPGRRPALAVGGSPRDGLPVAGELVFLPHLPVGQETSVALSGVPAEDPYVKALVPGFRLVPRPGRTILLDFPLVSTGGITGTARIQTPSGPAGLPGLRLELADPEGRVRHRATSAFDGFFDLADLMPGAYLLRVAEGEPARLGIEAPPPRAFQVGPEGTVFDGVEIALRPAVPGPG